MSIKQQILSIKTHGRATLNITNEVNSILQSIKIKSGICNLFLQHTSASIILCENYDSQVREDFENFLLRLIPDGDPLFKHVMEGEDDMPAHIRTLLTDVSLNIPISEGNLALGTWQGIYLYEHRYQPQNRNILLSFIS